MGSHARAALRLALPLALVIVAGSLQVVAAQTTGVDLTGTWDWTNVSEQTGSFQGVATIEHEVAAGTLTWTWTGNTTSSIWEGTGTVSGNSFTMSGHEGDTYTAEQTGTIVDANHLQGSWTQSDGQYGTSSAVRISGPGSGPTACTSALTNGYFEPTQGVWQDDAILPGTEGSGIVEAFSDLPDKQLEKLGSLGGEIRYEAQLDMVRGRPTALFGIDHAVGNITTPADRFNIVFEGTTDCTVAEPTRVRFTLVQGGSVRRLATSSVLKSVKLSGPAGATSTFKVRLPVRGGFPERAFTFGSEGDYLISGELIAGGNETGLKVDVAGEVVRTSTVKTMFAPIAINDRSAAAKSALSKKTLKMAIESYRHVPDMFPLPPRGFKVAAAPVEDISSYVAAARQEWVDWLRQLADFTTNERLFSQVRLAAVDRRFAGITQLSQGTGRVVAIFSDDDFDLLLPRSLRGRVAGFTSSSKFIAVPSDAGWQTVAHEYAHSVPEFLWSKDEMVAECGVDYHNATVDVGLGRKAPLQIAHGYRLTEGPDNEVRVLRDPAVSIMGPAVRDPWIDQCTYWHLLKVLQQPVDPPTVLVQGRLGRTDSDAIGELFPLYQLDGVVDLAPGTDGDWAFVLRAEGGNELGRYPFDPQWTLDDGTSRDIISFSFRLPDLEETTAIELVGPGGVLDVREYSASAPTVEITRPAEGRTVRPVDGTVTIEWNGTDADSDEHLYTVSYSRDGGRSWSVQEFEISRQRARVKLGKGNNHMVRVTVTDGARSGYDDVSFNR